MEATKGMPVKSANFINIKVLRAFSCIIVMVVHLGQRMELQGTVRMFTNFGANGVYFFFCISGFLGYLSYEKCCDTCAFLGKRS